MLELETSFSEIFKLFEEHTSTLGVQYSAHQWSITDLARCIHVVVARLEWSGLLSLKALLHLSQRTFESSSQHFIQFGDIMRSLCRQKVNYFKFGPAIVISRKIYETGKACGEVLERLYYRVQHCIVCEKYDRNTILEDNRIVVKRTIL